MPDCSVTTESGIRLEPALSDGCQNFTGGFRARLDLILRLPNIMPASGMGPAPSVGRLGNIAGLQRSNDPIPLLRGRQLRPLDKISGTLHFVGGV